MSYQSDGPGVAVLCVLIGVVVMPDYFWRFHFTTYRDPFLILPGAFLLSKGIIDLLIEFFKSLRRR